MTDAKAALTKAVEEGARASLDAVRGAHRGETLNGFALCTDDDLVTLYCVAITKEYCDASDDPLVRFVAVDWPYEENGSALAQANQLLSQRTLEELEARFSCLVSALASMRGAGLFDWQTLLIVTSTDPGPKLRKLGNEALLLLNDGDLASGCLDVIGR
jgi:hypothetical protein